MANYDECQEFFMKDEDGVSLFDSLDSCDQYQEFEPFINNDEEYVEALIYKMRGMCEFSNVRTLKQMDWEFDNDES